MTLERGSGGRDSFLALSYMHTHFTWTIHPIFYRSLIYSSASFLRLGSLVVCFLYLFFVVAGSDSLAANYTLSCYGLFEHNKANTYVDYRWILPNTPASDTAIYPELASMKRGSETQINYYYYWPEGYGNGTRQQAPVCYSVHHVNLDVTINNGTLADCTNALEQLSSIVPQQKAAFQSISASFDSNGELQISANFLPSGRIRGNGVVTHDASGWTVLAFPDSSGFVEGYEAGLDGTFTQVWYDTANASGNYAIKLDSLSGVNSSSLTYDSTTGLYSFSQPDYSPILSTINESVQKLASKELVIDDIRLELPDDFAINVSPEVTVNPTVTVTPDVTVNVTAPTQNDITVAIDNSDVLQSIERLQDWSEESLEYIDSRMTEMHQIDDFDTTSPTLSQDEQDLVGIVNGWETQIPVISNACDFALGAALGNIPTIPPSDLVPIRGINIFGFVINIDLTPFREHLRWFRAFCLMLEIVWFVNSLWRVAMKAMQV